MTRLASVALNFTLATRTSRPASLSLACRTPVATDLDGTARDGGQGKARQGKVRQGKG